MFHIHICKLSNNRFGYKDIEIKRLKAVTVNNITNQRKTKYSSGEPEKSETQVATIKADESISI